MKIQLLLISRLHSMASQQPNPNQPSNKNLKASNKNRKKPLNNGKPDKTDQ